MHQLDVRVVPPGNRLEAVCRGCDWTRPIQRGGEVEPLPLTIHEHRLAHEQ